MTRCTSATWPPPRCWPGASCRTWRAPGARHHAVARLAEFLAGNDQFFLNLAMAAGKATADAAAGVADSTLVTTLARNGTEFGIRVAGLGDRWLTAPVKTPVGLYFPGFGPDDANPDMGDSAIVETIGLGGVAMAASPAVARFVGAGGSRRRWPSPRRCARSAPASTRTSASPRSTSAARRGHRRSRRRRDRHHAADQHGHRGTAGRDGASRRRGGAGAAGAALPPRWRRSRISRSRRWRMTRGWLLRSGSPISLRT